MALPNILHWLPLSDLPLSIRYLYPDTYVNRSFDYLYNNMIQNPSNLVYY